MKFNLIDNYKHSVFLSIICAGTVYGIWQCYDTGVWWPLLVAYILNLIHLLFANNIGMHRLFAHRTFKTQRWKEVVLAWWSILLGGKGPIGWCAVHRHHHVHSDKARDPHSPSVLGRWYVITGMWGFESAETFYKRTKMRLPKDLMRDPMLMFIEQHYFKIWTVLATVLFFIGSLNTVIYGLLAPSAIYILHANLITNTFSHGFILPGTYRNFATDDSSTNHWLCQLLTLGEGYQNNHHQDCTTCSQATKPGEFDPAAWVVDKFFAIKETDNV